jgi:hypothetical protein
MERKGERRKKKKKESERGRIFDFVPLRLVSRFLFVVSEQKKKFIDNVSLTIVRWSVELFGAV